MRGTLRDNHPNTEFPHYLWGWAVGRSPSQKHTHTHTSTETERMRSPFFCACTSMSSGDNWEITGATVLIIWIYEKPFCRDCRCYNLFSFFTVCRSSDLELVLHNYTAWEIDDDKLMTLVCSESPSVSLCVTPLEMLWEKSDTLFLTDLYLLQPCLKSLKLSTRYC